MKKKLLIIITSMMLVLTALVCTGCDKDPKTLEDYLADRGFNFEFRDLPFAIAETNDELERNIKAFDENAFL